MATQAAALEQTMTQVWREILPFNMAPFLTFIHGNESKLTEVSKGHHKAWYPGISDGFLVMKDTTSTVYGELN